MVETDELQQIRPESASMTGREPAHYLLAFAIGTLVGMGVASVWIPERRHRRLPGIVRRRSRRIRKVGSTALGELRDAGRELTGEFREELGATLEAAREELADMTRQQLRGLRSSLGRERKGSRR